MPRRRLMLVTLLLAGTPLPALAQAMPAETPLSAPQLDTLRGGFNLPGGGTVTMGVVTETRINGQEVLRTVFNVQTGLPVLTVLTRNADGSVSSATPTANGTAVTTADGTVRLVAMPNGTRVELAGDRIDVSHLVGQSFGSVVANSADNRVVDVSTTINIGLSGIARDALGSSAASVDTLALDATSRLAR